MTVMFPYFYSLVWWMFRGRSEGLAEGFCRHDVAGSHLSPELEKCVTMIQQEGGYLDPMLYSRANESVGSGRAPHEKTDDTAIVLMWDNPWGTPFYWGVRPTVNTPNYAGYTIKKSPCARKCDFVTDRSLVTVADALLFDSCYYGTDREWRRRPPYLPERREGQPWGWFAYEQKNYFKLMGQPEWLSRFDFKVTYHHDADVQVTFHCPWGHKEFENLRDPPPPKDDKHFAAFIASNCGAGGADKRTRFVSELMKYIPVDSFGLCLHNADMPEGKGWHTSFGNMMDLKMRTIGRYKFFLAFENSNEVDDYVSEKLINALFAGAVPVYRGAPNVERWVPNDHSVINVADFNDNPRALANYLLQLARDDEAYNRYFDWKKKPYKENFQRLLDSCVFDAECRICDLVHEMRDQSHEDPRMSTNVPAGVVDAYAISLNSIDERLRLTADFVAVPAHPLLNLRKDYTLMAWIRMDLIGDGRIIDKAEAGAIDGYEFGVIICGNGMACIRLCASGNCFMGSRRLHRGIWYHVAVSLSLGEGGIRLYVNGKLDAVHSTSEETRTNDYGLQLGYAHNGQAWRPVGKSGTFDGLIDDVSIWDTVLPAGYIHDTMFTRFSGKEPGLIAYWGFNEGKGTAVHSVGSAKLTGSLVGQVRWVPAITKPLVEISEIETM